MTKAKEAVGRFSRRWWPPLAGLASTALLTGAQFTDAEWTIFGGPVSRRWALFGAGILLGLLALAAYERRTRALIDWQSERQALVERAQRNEDLPLDLMRDELARLAENAGHMSNERVSLYRCHGDGFCLVARVSASPTYMEDLGRHELPINQGLVGEAWQKSTAEAVELPNPGPATNPPTRQWLNEQRRLGVPEDVAREFRMRSQAYVAFRIERQGVLVFESTVSKTELANPTKMTAAELKPAVSEYSPRLEALLRASHVLDPTQVRERLKARQGADRDRTQD